MAKSNSNVQVNVNISTKKRVRYPEAISDLQFSHLAALRNGEFVHRDRLAGLQQRGLVNASGSLTALGRQFADQHVELLFSRERIAELQRVNREQRTYGRKTV